MVFVTLEGGHKRAEKEPIPLVALHESIRGVTYPIKN